MSSLERLWSPRGVAVVGASGRDGAMGQLPVRYLIEHGYTGAIYPVNPNYQEVLGRPCFPTVAACPGPVDLALVMVQADKVSQAITDCASKGVGYAVVLASGFAESGGEGAERQAAMIAQARAVGLTLIGPNCIGLVNPHANLVAGFSPLFARAQFQPGEIGLVTQSGALGFGIASLALDRGLHFSRILNTGNEGLFTSAEAVRDLLLDDVTQVVLVYSEGLQAPRQWLDLARLALERGKPIVMLKAGRSQAGARAAASHTAALAGDDAAYTSAFAQLGILRVADIDELLDLAAAFRQPRLPTGNRVGILTTSGGAGIMAADGCSSRGLTVPELTGETRRLLETYVPAFGSAVNPVDVTAQVLADREVFRRCLGQLMADDGLDGVIACFCVLTGASAEQTVADLVAVADSHQKPLLVAKTGGDSLAPNARRQLLAAGLPVFETPVQAAAALAALLAFQRSQRRVEAVREIARIALVGGDGLALPAGFPAGAALTERETKAALAAHGLPVPADRIATTAAEAVGSAEAFGYPVVLKIESPDILHKTEAGGVALGLADADSVRQAFARIMDSARTYNPAAQLQGVLVQEQVVGGAEFLVGVTPSPFGPLLTVGAGGVLVEVLQDATRRLLPLDRAEAEAALDELRIAAVLGGVRGRPALDRAALVDLLLQVSRLAAGAGGDWELDLNPVIVLPEGQGVRILDALFVTHPSAGGAGHGTV